MNKITALLCLLTLQLGAATGWALPETVSVQLTDVTPSSFSVAWMTDVPAVPDVELFADAAMATRLSNGTTVTPMPDAPPMVADAARSNGIMKVRVSGLSPDTGYFVRTVTRDPAAAGSVNYSPLMQVTTAKEVLPYRPAADGTLPAFSNDLLTMKVFLRAGAAAEQPGLGALIILSSGAAAYPVSAFAGAGVSAPGGALDLANLFGPELTSYLVRGGERVLLSVYRGGTLATLEHYRRLPAPGQAVAVVEPVPGFFADLDLDGRIDGADFERFRKQYRSVATDSSYNPDFDLVPDAEGRVDARDFARFAREYGRTDVK
ncbi:MAG: hypothetical protein A2075_13290 [Geobacteraceae bacterium GWC2_58_44]|nr:MAG: hypothetical protein A2075_13290 [Geobacteraceae bacterium GWC2_58_44]HBG08227.1 hypothetical protein [Geobacter sp.]